MIQKARVNPHSGLQPKYPLDSFWSDNQSKSQFFLRPPLSSPTTFVSPFDSSLQLYAQQKFFFKFNQYHTLGFTFDVMRLSNLSYRKILVSYEYQQMKKHKVRVTAGCGNNLLLGLEYHRKLRYNIVGSLYGSYLQSFHDGISSVGVGIKQDNSEAVISIEAQSEAILSYKYGIKQFPNQMRLSLYCQLSLFGRSSFPTIWPGRQVQLQLSYPIRSVRASLIASLVRMETVRIQFDKKTHYGRVGVAAQCHSSGHTVLYLAINKKNFKLSLPIMIIDSVIPTAIFGLAYLLGTLSVGRTNKQQKKRTEEDRKKQLKLISENANKNFMKQKANNGLVILQAYYGSQFAIADIYRSEGQHRQLDPRVIDVTIPLRFLVDEGVLRIKPNNRESIYGFYNPNPDGINKTIVIYRKGDVLDKAVFSDYEEIWIV